MDDDYFDQETSVKQPVPSQASWEPLGSRDEVDRVQPPKEQSTPRDPAQTVREPPRSRTMEEPELTLFLGTVKNVVDSYMEALSRQSSSRYKLPVSRFQSSKLEETGDAS